MPRFTQIVSAISILAVLCGCMRREDVPVLPPVNAGNGIFVLCEGNFQYGNASLSFYSPTTRTVENEVFYRANGMKLGDVAQSMVIHNGTGWIVVNNSHVIFAIDTDTYRERGRITNVASARYMHFVSDDKAYITQLWSNRILIADPSHYAITGAIEVPGMDNNTGSTEQMAQIGKYVYCTCWSYQNTLIRIDTETDRVTGSLIVGRQPRCVVADAMQRLWILCDGGYDGSPTGSEQPSLVCVDAATFAIARVFSLGKDSSPSALIVTDNGQSIMWLDKNTVWQMPTDAEKLPDTPFIVEPNVLFYALAADETASTIYVADAVDYLQRGVVRVYDSHGLAIDKFRVGVSPGSFCIKRP